MAKFNSVLLGVSALLIPEAFATFDCSLIATPDAATDGAMTLINNYVEQNREAGTIEFANE